MTWRMRASASQSYALSFFTRIKPIKVSRMAWREEDSGRQRACAICLCSTQRKEGDIGVAGVTRAKRVGSYGAEITLKRATPTPRYLLSSTPALSSRGIIIYRRSPAPCHAQSYLARTAASYRRAAGGRAPGVASLYLHICLDTNAFCRYHIDVVIA